MLGDYAWYEGNSWAKGARSPLPVGLKRPNPWGLYDIYGNAWEWVADWYDAGRYGDMQEVDPEAPENCRAVVEGELLPCTDKVIRGGAFNTTEDTTRGAARSFATPDVVDNNVGFRCAYDR